MNSNQRITRRTSPGRDPVVLAMKAAAAVLAAVALLLLVHLLQGARAQAAVQCPPQDHAVWASSLHLWLCGASQTIGVTAK